MNTTVVGAGYVGFSLAVLFAGGHDVTVLETNENKVRTINDGKSPLSEKALVERTPKVRSRLKATSDPSEAYEGAELVIVAVPTDFDETRGSFNVGILTEALTTAIERTTDATVVIKSTIPTGYTKRIRKKLNSNRILFSPEFMREGRSLFDVSNPTRIVAGYAKGDEESRKRAVEFCEIYRELVENDPKTLVMTAEEAESVKLFANSYLAMRVAFFNELDAFCEANDLDSRNVIDGVCSDSRIGDGYANPSFGYGGYCFPKDSRQLASQMGSLPGELIRAIPDANDVRIETIAKKAMSETDGTIGIYGLSMKTGSDNSRSSSSLRVARRINDLGGDVLVFDERNRTADPDLKFADSFEEFTSSVDLILANRIPRGSELEDYVKNTENGVPVYTRDVYGEG